MAEYETWMVEYYMSSICKLHIAEKINLPTGYETRMNQQWDNENVPLEKRNPIARLNGRTLEFALDGLTYTLGSRQALAEAKLIFDDEHYIEIFPPSKMSEFNRRRNAYSD